MPRPPVKTAPARTPGPSRSLIGGVVGAAILVIALLVYLAVRSGSTDSDTGGSANAKPGGEGITIGKTTEGAPEVHVYEDFQCPFCGDLENTSGAALVQAAEAGKINLTYTIMSFLDGGLGNDSSSRTANAALCADDQGAFAPFHAAVYGDQPAQEGTGWTDQQLIGYGEASGITGKALNKFTTCLQRDTYGDYVKAMQTKANESGVTGTPRLFIDGKQITDEQMNALMIDPTALDRVLAGTP